jgi:hypothetical protein
MAEIKHHSGNGVYPNISAILRVPAFLGRYGFGIVTFLAVDFARSKGAIHTRAIGQEPAFL